MALAVLVVAVTVVLARGQRPFMELTARGTFVGSMAFSPDGAILAAGDPLQADLPTSAPARIYLWGVS